MPVLSHSRTRVDSMSIPHWSVNLVWSFCRIQEEDVLWAHQSTAEEHDADGDMF
jgi:hypothetical protein